MSWVSDYKYAWYERVIMKVVVAGGHIPRHIAFVMDGNRRFAQSAQIQKIDGHARGFEKLADCLRWCLDIGIREVTTFAFSIENFKRTEEEVNGLFDLAREKFNKLQDEFDNFHKHGVCIRVVGNLALLPEDIQRLMAKCVLETEKNNKLFLNIAFSYTSRDEITQSVETILKYGAELQEEDISDRLLEECLYTRHSSPPDLLFRTSGESRLSDFLMWQIPTTVLYFTKVLWPQITLWDFLAGIFVYQRASISMEPFRKQERLRRAQVAKRSNFYTDRVQRFLHKLDMYRKNMVLKLTSSY